MPAQPALEARQLAVEVFDETIAEWRPLVALLDLALGIGQGVGVTGESGSGKTTLSLALAGLLPDGARIVGPHGSGTPHAGSDRFMLFQEPRASLNPYRTIRWQLERCRRRGRRRPSGGRAESPQRSLPPLDDTMCEVGLQPEHLACYPHQLSTGMCQRVFFAMARELDARVLIADEPFASVDPETRGRLAELLERWMAERGLSLLLVSHDLELLRRLTKRLLVLYRGQVAEQGPTAAVLSPDRQGHPYSWLLGRVDRCSSYAEISPYIGPPGDARVACCFAPRCHWADAQVCTEPVPAVQHRVVDGEPVALRCLRGAAGELRAVADIPAPRATERKGGAEHESEACESASPGHMLPASESGRYSPLSAPGQGSNTAAPERIQHACLRDDVPAPTPLLRVTGLVKEYRLGWWRRRTLRALDGISFELEAGSRLGIMGPSGQGKTTLARVVTGLLRPTAGSVELWHDQRWCDVHSSSISHAHQPLRRRFQLLYQDADLVLDPAARVGDSLVEAYRVFDPRLDRQTGYRYGGRILEDLGLDPALREAYPYRLSGGERKRVCLARVLAALGYPGPAPPETPPRILVLDEPTAGMDVVVQAVVAHFLLGAQQALRLSYLVISHDEPFVRRFCHRALYVERGRVKRDGGPPAALPVA
jgi:peptide/nickel transport system ATP-binding protein